MTNRTPDLPAAGGKSATGSAGIAIDLSANRPIYVDITIDDLWCIVRGHHIGRPVEAVCADAMRLLAKAMIHAGHYEFQTYLREEDQSKGDG